MRAPIVAEDLRILPDSSLSLIYFFNTCRSLTVSGYGIFEQVRARDQVYTVVILSMFRQDIDLFFAEYPRLIQLFRQYLNTYVLCVFTSPKAYLTYKHLVEIMG